MSYKTVTKACADCGHDFTKGKQARYCHQCARSRERHASLVRARKNDLAQRARSKVANAMYRGDLPMLRVPQTEIVCVDCGAPARAWDHRDYLFPLWVSPVCGSCNKKRGPGKNASSAELKAG